MRMRAVWVLCLGLSALTFGTSASLAEIRTRVQPAHLGNFAALRSIYAENVIFSVGSRIDFKNLSIVMNCESVSDGLTYQRIFSLSDRQMRPFTLRRSRGRYVGSSNFSAISAIGPRLGQVDISMAFSTNRWNVNIQVQAVATDSDSSNVNELCEGTTVFRAIKNFGRN